MIAAFSGGRKLDAWMASLDHERLCKAVSASRQMLSNWRRERREAVKEYIGAHYSEDGQRHKVPYNGLSLYVSIYGRNLIAKNPRVMLSTFDHSLTSTVDAMQNWVNHELERMKFAETIRRIVIDGLFSIGIAKVSLADPPQAAKVGWGLKAGEASIQRVDLDDFVFDMHARDFEECGFIGHKYRVPLATVIDSKLYSKSRKTLTASTPRIYNEQGDARIETVSKGESVEDEYEDFVDLWEIYCPRYGAILTFRDDEGVGPAEEIDGEPLLGQKWIGPYCGPFHFLPYMIVPGNAMPKGPIQDIIDLHLAQNETLRKIMRQTERAKEIYGVQGGADADGNRTLQSNDGDMVKIDNPANIARMQFGGAQQEVIAASLAFKNLFDEAAGNISTLGGLSAQAKTATQEKMLNDNSGAGVADKQETTISFVSSVVKALCWYWWHDPYKVMRTKYELPGLERSITRYVKPQQRQQGRFEDLDIKVDPYSMAHSTPQMRIQGLIQIIKELWVPLAQPAMAQGITPDLRKLFKLAGKYFDQPDLERILGITEPMGQPQNGGGATMPQSTERRYVRESMPGRTQKGSDLNLMSSLLGVDPGGAQKNGQLAG